MLLIVGDGLHKFCLQLTEHLIPSPNSARCVKCFMQCESAFSVHGFTISNALRCVLQVELPQCELALARCDDAAEFDDSVDQQQIFDDDPAVVLFRKANKIGFSVTVTPRQDGDVKVCN
jgi:hypothetical protein